MPFAIYRTFVLEEKYGFNKTTPGLFVKDLIKGNIISLVLNVILTPLIFWIIHISGPDLVINLAGITVIIAIIFSILMPTVIIPLFNTYSDLEDGELREAIIKETKKTDVKVSQIKVIDGSTRSSHSNAFVTGFWWFRKVVLYDTLIKDLSKEEICAIVNHELGHVVHKHSVYSMVEGCLSMLLMFYCFAYTLGNKAIIDSFGFSNKSNFLSLYLFGKLYLPVDYFQNFLALYLSRRAEYQADAFAIKHGHAESLKTGLVNLYKRNKGPLVTDPLYSSCTNSHPTLIERLMAID